MDLHLFWPRPYICICWIILYVRPDAVNLPRTEGHMLLELPLWRWTKTESTRFSLGRKRTGPSTVRLSPQVPCASLPCAATLPKSRLSPVRCLSPPCAASLLCAAFDSRARSRYAIDSPSPQVSQPTDLFFMVPIGQEVRRRGWCRRRREAIAASLAARRVGASGWRSTSHRD